MSFNSLDDIVNALKEVYPSRGIELYTVKPSAFYLELCKTTGEWKALYPETTYEPPVKIPKNGS